VLVIAAVVVAVAAIAASVSLHNAGGANVPARWMFGGVPGVAIVGDPLTALSTEQSGVSSTVREVIGAGQGFARLHVLASSNAAGVLCFASRGSGTISAFHCLSANDSDRALIPFISEGGATATQVDYTIIAGVARSDVARIDLVFSDGTSEVVHLGAWRAFGATASGSQPPKALRAFDASGAELQSIDVGASPLCGDASGPCRTSAVAGYAAS
jgi:hypothetical protein